MTEKRDGNGNVFFNRVFTFFAVIMLSPINYRQCLCCGSAAISKVFTCTDFTVSHEQFEVWKCSNCTFRFTQDAPAAGAVSRYYQSENYVSHSDTKQGLINWLYHFVRNFSLQMKLGLIRKATGLKQGVLLDVGAGTGAFANEMQKAGWNVTGLEPDEIARQKAQANYHLKLEDLSDLDNLVGETFDAITLWHVLEHVHDLHGYLEKFKEILKPSGVLLIAVPNYTSYDADFYQQYWAAYDVPRHLYHFSSKSMQVLLERKGFIVESVKPMWFDSFYVSMLSEKNREGGNIIRAIWVGLVSNWKAVFNTGKCSSVIYVVRKRD